MIHALRVAVQVPVWLERRREGRVHSLFARACNLAWGDDLISLVLPAHGMVPGGMAVELDGAWGFCPGDPVVWDPVGFVLRCGAVEIGLRGAGMWSNRAPLDSLAPVPLLAERVQQVAELARRQGRGTLVRAWAAGPAARAVPPSPADWGGYAVQQLEALCEAVRTGDPARTEELLGRVLGLGEGLTPSGDDFLIGFLAVLHYGGVCLSGHRAAAVARLALAAAQRAPRATTPVSANYLRLAADGSFSERAEAAALALLATEPGDWLAAASALIDSGHSSGTDTLMGIIFGAGLLSPET